MMHLPPCRPSRRPSIVILVTLAVLTIGLASACYVPNRVYNRVTDQNNGSTLNESIVRVNLGSSPPDVVEPNCTPEPFPEVGNPRTGSEHACMSFLEFDDMGELWDKDHLPKTIEMIDRARARAAALNKRPIVILFVHGWKNNANRQDGRRNGNVNGFEGVLAHMASSHYAGSPVVGVYVGWRGDLVPKYWPVRRQFSYFDRERAAIRTPGAAMTSSLIKIATAAHQTNNAYVLMIGHSFGALLLERALAQAMADFGVQAIGGSLGAGAIAGGAWADLVVYVNSAAAATEGKQMLDLLKQRMTAQNAAPATWPIFVSVSSLGDTATRFAMPIGHGTSFLGFKARRSFRDYTKADPPQPAVKGQGAYYTSTLAHMQAVQSHLILEASDCTARPGAVLVRGPVVFPNGLTYVLCEKPPDRWNTTPYWVMQMPASIVRSHSDIFNTHFAQLLTMFAPQ